MIKRAASVLVLAFLMLNSSASPTGLWAAHAKTEVATSVFIAVTPDKPEASTPVNVKIWIDPAPPSPSDQFHGLVLTIKRPDGITNNYSALTRNVEDGAYYWSYMISQLGNYTFQCSYTGESFADGAIWYKASQSSVVTITAIGDAAPPVEAQGGSWVQKESLNQGRAALGVAVINGKIYAIGGSINNGTYLPKYGGGFIDTNEEYDPLTDTWTIKKPMPTPRYDFAIAACENKIYCIGGVVGFRLDDVYNLFQVREMSNVNEVYDPTSDTWEVKTAMPMADSGMQAHVIDGKIFVFNGKIIMVYDPASDSWTTKTPPPFGIEGFASAEVDSKIFVIGNYLPVLIYDAENDSWSEGARSPRLGIIGPAVATAGVLAPKRMYVFAVAQFGWVPYGETDISGYSRRTTFVYNPENDSWSAGTVIPTYRVNFGIAPLNHTVYVVGGYTFDVNNLNSDAIVSGVTEQYVPIGYGSVPQVPATQPSSISAAEPEVFPITRTVAVAGVTVAVIGLSLVLYFKRRKKARA